MPKTKKDVKNDSWIKRIPDTPENVAKALMSTSKKKRKKVKRQVYIITPTYTYTFLIQLDSYKILWYITLPQTINTSRKGNFMSCNNSQKGLSLIKLLNKFPDDKTSEQWFVKSRWPNGIECPYCEYNDIQIKPDCKTQPYRCRACKRHFSVRVGTVMQGSRLGYQKWVLAIYLLTTSPKGISSVQLGKDLGISQKAAWYLAHRIREGWKEHQDLYNGPDL